MMTKTLDQQFNQIAGEYDARRTQFIPCFDDFYHTTTEAITCAIPALSRVLDLGAGTGILTECWYRYFPKAEYVLVDIADDMLAAAQERFAGNPHVSCVHMDFTQGLPEGQFDVIVSGLSIHHLEDVQKQDLFSRTYEKLPDGGIFVNYDQFCAGTPELNHWFDAFWERQLASTALNKREMMLWTERRQLDRECSSEEETEMLRKSGFRIVKTIYTYHKFSVIVAVK